MIKIIKTLFNKSYRFRKKMSVLKIEMLEGYTKIPGYLTDQELSVLSRVSDRIVKIGLLLRKFGLGNRSYRNCTAFSGDLILKHPLFVNVLEKLVPIAESQLGESFQISEYNWFRAHKLTTLKCGGIEIFRFRKMLIKG